MQHSYKERFLDRIFSIEEIHASSKKDNKFSYYAKRWAAKEACAKALGIGISKGVSFKEIIIVNLPNGKPTLKLEGGTLAILRNLIPENHRAFLHTTLTDDFPWAQAFVIIEAIPEK